QREWNVEISGRGVSFFESRPRLGESRLGDTGPREALILVRSVVARSCISPAAFLVNVTARIRSGLMRLRIRAAMRYVTTRVFPVPAPARTSSGPLRVRTASSCGGFKSAGIGNPFRESEGAIHRE